MTASLTKQPNDANVLYNLPCASLGLGVTIQSIGPVVITPAGRVAELAALVSADAGFSGDVIQFRLSGGTDGEIYHIAVAVTDSLGQTFEEDADLRVEDFTWGVPDGQGHIYLTPAEYVTRFGYEETKLLSDTHDVGRIDKDRLGARLIEATALVDGYVAKRYTTPLDPAPEVIRAIVADLARFSLHGENVPDVVDSRYKLAKSTLKDISAGGVLLPAPEKTSDSSGAPDFISPARVFDRNSLKDF